MKPKTNEIFINRYKVLFFLFIYKVTIEIIYISVISPMYTYYGLITDISLYKYIFSLFYFLIFYFLIPLRKNHPSSTIFIMIGLFMFIPTIVYYWMSSQNDLFTFIYVLCFFIIGIILRFRRFKLADNFKVAQGILASIFLLYIGTSILIIGMQGGIDSRAFDFSEIYSLRQDINLPTIFQYFLNWNVKVLTPFYFAYFYYKDRMGYVIITLIIQLLYYLTFGYKAYLFSIGFLLMCLIINKYGIFEILFINAYNFLNVISVTVWSIFGNNILLETVPFRMVFVPTQAQYQYYSFFSINPKYNFAQGMIGAIFQLENTYNLPMFQIISYAFYGRYFSQNTGVFGDAYGNGGFIAMILISILLGIVLYTIDIVSLNVPKIIVIAAFSYEIFVLNDNSLLTSLLTGGIGLLIIMFYLFNAELEYKKSQSSPKISVENEKSIFLNRLS